jgi:hypothetical protein
MEYSAPCRQLFKGFFAKVIGMAVGVDHILHAAEQVFVPERVLKLKNARAGIDEKLAVNQQRRIASETLVTAVSADIKIRRTRS